MPRPAMRYVVLRQDEVCRRRPCIRFGNRGFAEDACDELNLGRYPYDGYCVTTADERGGHSACIVDTQDGWG